MRRPASTLGLFYCLAVVQIAVPVMMIVRNQAVMRTGRQFRFVTLPVDPYDAFRGRYVALGFEQDRVYVPEGIGLKRGQKAYALIEENDRGFAEIAGISEKRPAGNDYVQVCIGPVTGREVHLRFPFDRYYMEEKFASAAESAYMQSSRTDRQDAYAVIRVKSGYALVEELYIAGKPVVEFLRENP